jgi:lipid II:glycine glycyltransferase (peptidoglycan interpeptide bridge formation enzyme)
MQRLDAGDSYHFPDEYFHDLKAALGPRLHLYSVLSPAGEMAAAGLFTEQNGIVQFHLSGTSGQYRKQAPSKLMLEEAILRSRAAGNHTLHLGGGLGASEDSLFLFKAGFSPLRARFATWRFVCDPARYATLTGDSPVSATGYFPAYRKAA